MCRFIIPINYLIRKYKGVYSSGTLEKLTELPLLLGNLRIYLLQAKNLFFYKPSKSVKFL